MTGAAGKRWTDGAVPILSTEAFGAILAEAADLALMVDAGGTVRSVLADTESERFAPVAGWLGVDLRDTLTFESVPKIDAALAALDSGEEPSRAEVNHRLRGAGEIPIRYTLHALGEGGDALLVGRDLGQVSEIQKQLVDAQIELERDYEDRRAIEARYRMVLAHAREPMALVDERTGQMVDLNPALAAVAERSMDALRDALLSTVLAEPDLAALAEAGEDEVFPARLVRGDEVPVRATRFRAGGRRLVLLQIDAAAEAGARSGGGGVRALWDAAPEGFVLTDREGTIVSASDGFLELIDAPTGASARGRSLAAFLMRGAVDLRVLLDNAARGGVMRAFATRLVGTTRRETPVEMSISALPQGAGAAFGLVIRDASRLERGGPAVDEKAAASVAALVGNSPLREIVSETTDVVEKMCIETAVDLTNNNRVAAAEMLGLSRQSLYVKLRKYGLLNRDG